LPPRGARRDPGIKNPPPSLSRAGWRCFVSTRSEGHMLAQNEKWFETAVSTSIGAMKPPLA